MIHSRSLSLTTGSPSTLRIAAAAAAKP